MNLFGLPCFPTPESLNPLSESDMHELNWSIDEDLGFNGFA
jgi:hypothetical protein